MNKDPMEMPIEELDALFGKPVPLSTITHVLAYTENVNHDRFRVEVITEDSRRLSIGFTQSALRNLMKFLGDRVNVDRPRAN